MDNESDSELRLSDSDSRDDATEISEAPTSPPAAAVQCTVLAEPFVLPKHSAQDFKNALLEVNRGFRPSFLQQPWERGPFANLFGKPTSSIPEPRMSMPLPAMPRADVQQASSSTKVLELAIPTRQVKRPLFPFVMRRLREVAIPYDGDAKRAKAINRWRMILELDLEASAVGRQLSEYAELGDCEALIVGTLQDVFGKKAVGTLLKRAASILRYVWWTRKNGIDMPLQFKEQTCYMYIKALEKMPNSVSAGKSFVQALNFSRYLLGMEQVEAATKSARILGACSTMLRKKKPLAQAPAYTQEQVLVLHHVVSRGVDVRDRCKAGYDLFCIYASCRHDDAMAPEKAVADIDEGGFGFLELYTCKHKVANTDERRSVFLPLVAITPGIYRDSSWALDWIRARSEAGLSFVDQFTMPTPSSEGGWINKPLETGESATWTRELLVSYGYSGIIATVRPRSHSGKTTVLAWACKYGIKKDHRRTLGHHIDRGDSSVITYSRAALDVPLSQVVKMIEDIVSGKFDPDSSRLIRLKMARVSKGSKEFCSRNPDSLKAVPSLSNPTTSNVFDSGEAPNDQQLGEECWQIVERPQIDPKVEGEDFPVPVVHEIVSSESDSKAGMHDLSDCSSSSCSDSSLDERTAKELCVGMGDQTMPFVDSQGKPLTTMQHCNSGLLHCREFDLRLACGRLVTECFSVVQSLKCKWPVCSQCRSKFPIPTLAPKPKALAGKVAP